MKVSKNVTFTLENIHLIQKFMDQEGINNFSLAINTIITMWIRKEKIVKDLETIAQARQLELESAQRKLKLKEKMQNENKKD